MIKSNMGEVEISGVTPIIMAEFSALTKGMIESLTENYGKTKRRKWWKKPIKEVL